MKPSVSTQLNYNAQSFLCDMIEPAAPRIREKIEEATGLIRLLRGAVVALSAGVDSTHVDDLGDDRPGLKAAQEAGVISPLLLASFSKADVRESARMLGLPVWDKPAMPCLSSRIPHGEEITSGKLRMIGQAELRIKRLTGTKNLRVRYSDGLARIEVSPEERKLFFDERIMDDVDGELRRLGFVRVTLDLRGYSRTEPVVAADPLTLPMAHVS